MILKTARAFKGRNYAIDAEIPLSALIGFSIRRIVALIRCVLRGVVVSFDIRSLVFLGPDVQLKNRKFIRFGKSVSIGKGSIIDGLARKGVTIGDKVSIGPYSIIESTGVLTSLGEGCSIGNNSGVSAFTYIGAAGGVWIGNNVIMGQRVSFHAENHRYSRTDILIRDQGVMRQGITIEDDCWVGACVTFLDGAYVERGCVIAAGAVVRGRIPAYSVVAGVPAKVIKSRLTMDVMTNNDALIINNESTKNA